VAGHDETEQDDVLTTEDLEPVEEFLDGFLEKAEFEATITRRPLDGGVVEVAIEGDDLGPLIGPRGQTLAALQELARTVLQRQARGRAGRLVLDVGGYRQARRQALEAFTRDVAAQVAESGVARVLEPMNAADRKVIHDTCNTLDGVETHSEGEGVDRRVVIAQSPGN